MTEFYLFLWTFWWHWWPAIAAGIYLGFDEVARAWLPSVSKRLDQVPAWWRHRIAMAVLVGSVFSAGFSAWREEHEARTAAERSTRDFPAVVQRFAFDARLLTTNVSEGKTMAKRQEVIFKVKSEYAGMLTGIRLKILSIDPPGPFALTPPFTVSVAHGALNPMDSFEISMASYDKLDSRWVGLCYNAEGDGYPDHCGNDRSYEYAFYITAAESLPATIHLRIWLDGEALRFQIH